MFSCFIFMNFHFQNDIVGNITSLTKLPSNVDNFVSDVFWRPLCELQGMLKLTYMASLISSPKWRENDKNILNYGSPAIPMKCQRSFKFKKLIYNKLSGVHAVKQFHLQNVQYCIYSTAQSPEVLPCKTNLKLNTKHLIVKKKNQTSRFINIFSSKVATQ